MDRQTFDKFFENDKGTTSSVTVDLHLTPEENKLYLYVKNHHYRLEQEKVGHDSMVEQMRP